MTTDKQTDSSPAKQPVSDRDKCVAILQWLGIACEPAGFRHEIPLGWTVMDNAFARAWPESVAVNLGHVVDVLKNYTTFDNEKLLQRVALAVYSLEQCYCKSFGRAPAPKPHYPVTLGQLYDVVCGSSAPQGLKYNIYANRPVRDTQLVQQYVAEFNAGCAEHEVAEWLKRDNRPPFVDYGVYRPVGLHCPYCNNPTDAEYADVGVGLVQSSPHHCDNCGATEVGAYDREHEKSPAEVATGWYPPGADQSHSSGCTLNGKPVSSVEWQAVYAAVQNNLHKASTRWWLGLYRQITRAELLPLLRHYAHERIDLYSRAPATHYLADKWQAVLTAFEVDPSGFPLLTDVDSAMVAEFGAFLDGVEYARHLAITPQQPKAQS